MKQTTPNRDSQSAVTTFSEGRGTKCRELELHCQPHSSCSVFIMVLLARVRRYSSRRHTNDCSLYPTRSRPSQLCSCSINGQVIGPSVTSKAADPHAWDLPKYYVVVCLRLLSAQTVCGPARPGTDRRTRRIIGSTTCVCRAQCSKSVLPSPVL